MTLRTILTQIADLNRAHNRSVSNEEIETKLYKGYSIPISMLKVLALPPLPSPIHDQHAETIIGLTELARLGYLRLNSDGFEITLRGLSAINRTPRQQYEESQQQS